MANTERTPFWQRGVLLASASLLCACGSDSSGSADSAGAPNATGGSGASAASAGTSGVNGLSGAGSAGSSGASDAGGETNGGGKGSGGNASGGSGGNTSGGNASVGGGTIANGGSAGNAFDPSLPVPSIDCSSDTTDRQCVALSGTSAGQNVDLHCQSVLENDQIAPSPDAWLTQCLDAAGSPRLGQNSEIFVPVQAVGDFDYLLAPGEPYAGAYFSYTSMLQGGSSQSVNFLGGELKGSVTIVSDGAKNITVLAGTFHGSWNDGAGQTCNTEAVMKCEAGAINGSFRFVQAAK